MRPEGTLFNYWGSRKYLNSSERSRFRQAALKAADSLERAFLMTLFYTGARISEVLEVRVNNLDLDENLVAFRTLKQRDHIRFRTLPIPPELCELLQELETGEPDQRVWEFGRTTGWKIVKDCMMQAGIDGIQASPKGLRHGFAVACMVKQIPFATLKKWMGHARIESTTVYLDIVGDEEKELAKRLW